MRIEDLLKEAEGCLEVAKEIRSKEELLPVAFLCRGNTKTIVPLGWSSTEGKSRAVEMLRVVARVTQTDAVILILDAHVVKRNPGDPLDERPSEAPDRKEAIIANVLAKNGDMRVIIQPYVQEDGAVVFEEKTVIGPDGIDGIFNRIFEPEEGEQRWPM